jgi:hypothetical protein
MAVAVAVAVAVINPANSRENSGFLICRNISFWIHSKLYPACSLELLETAVFPFASGAALQYLKNSSITDGPASS